MLIIYIQKEGSFNRLQNLEEDTLTFEIGKNNYVMTKNVLKLGSLGKMVVALFSDTI